MRRLGAVPMVAMLLVAPAASGYQLFRCPFDEVARRSCCCPVEEAPSSTAISKACCCDVQTISVEKLPQASFDSDVSAPHPVAISWSLAVAPALSLTIPTHEPLARAVGPPLYLAHLAIRC